MVPKKPHKDEEVPSGEKKSTAEPEPKEDSHPQESRGARSEGPAPRATPPGTAGTPITVTPYRTSGNATFYTVGTVLVGSEQAAVESLKNQLFKPAIPS